MRIGGLASGMDTDAIIKKLMAAQRIPLDKLAQKKQALEWKRDDYRTLNSKILEFRNAAFDMKLQSGYLAKKVSSSQENIVSVTGTANANEGQYTIQIKELAASASLTSGDLAGPPGVGKKLSVLNLSSETELKVTGEKGTASITIKPTDSIEDLVSSINNNAASTGVKVSYDANMDRLFFSSSKSGQTSKINLELGNGDNINTIFGFSTASVQLEGSKMLVPSELIDNTLSGTSKFTIKYDNINYDFDVTSTTTMGDLVNQMNNKLTKVGVDASLNSSGKLTFANADKTKAITFSDDAGGAIVNKLGVDTPLKPNSAVISATGKNAKVLFNGIEAEYDSNTFSIAGMSFTAKQESSTVVNVGVTQDVSSVVDTIKKFVEKYNSLIDEVNKEVQEKRQRNFQPLTSEQREAMSEDEIKKWEERARSGMLSNDQLLTSGLSSLRISLSNSVSGLPAGQIKSLAEIGISNSNVNGSVISGTYADRGKLYIDEAKLTKALTEKPEEVMALFTAKGATESSDGIASRLYDKSVVLFKQITEKAGTAEANDNNYSMGKENKLITDQIARLTERLDDMEKRYYKQFTAMETYLNKMNSQSAWLTQQFSS
ncbi:flagellar hook-associated protein 2 [Paenibacillus castaneae]|uniref:flagellar filament capping protein FliD n=1 Tax=Paenibacillus castaneae TaxID=474957 RepID=UPI000C9CE95C|nr:flagellar filament capping protein FliD [Paenibacillus castaneae]NIK79337.1 flagellar hook-associated protein 2 [Paenibacillus castaneae]